MPGMGCGRTARVGRPGARSGTRAPPGRAESTSGYFRFLNDVGGTTCP